MNFSSQYTEIDREEDHFVEHAERMVEGEDTEYRWTFAPFNRNSTFLAVDDDAFQAWLKNKPSGRGQELKRHYRHLQRYNAGTHSREWRDNKWLKRCDDWYRCHAIADTLEMTEAEKDRVCRIYDEHIDMRSFPSEKFGEQAKWLVVPFCICVLVHNENQPTKQTGDRDDRYAYYPGKQNFPPRQTYAGSIRHDYEAANDRYAIFTDYAESLLLDEATIISCLERVRKKIPAFTPKPEIDFIRTDASNRVIHAEV